jgi:hypothetical protein
VAQRRDWGPTIFLAVLAIIVVAAGAIPEPAEDPLSSGSQVFVAFIGLLGVTVAALAVNRPEEWVAGTCVLVSVILALVLMFDGADGTALAALVLVGALTALASMLTGTVHGVHLLAAAPAGVVLAQMGNQPAVIACFAAALAVLGAATSPAQRA